MFLSFIKAVLPKQVTTNPNDFFSVRQNHIVMIHNFGCSFWIVMCSHAATWVGTGKDNLSVYRFNLGHWLLQKSFSPNSLDNYCFHKQKSQWAATFSVS